MKIAVLTDTNAAITAAAIIAAVSADAMLLYHVYWRRGCCCCCIILITRSIPCMGSYSGDDNGKRFITFITVS